MTNKEIIQQLLKAFETDDQQAMVTMMADDVTWHMVGVFTAFGKKEFLEHIRLGIFDGPAILTVQTIITEDSYVAVGGELAGPLNNGSLFKAFFNSTYCLENEKVKKITTFLVPMQAIND